MSSKISHHLIPATDRAIAALPAPASGNTCYWHAELKGLHLRILPSGNRTWRFQYRETNGTLRRLTLGRHPAVTLSAAIKAAQVAAGDIARGKDVAAERQQAKARTERFDSFLAGYLAHKASRRRERTVDALKTYLEVAFKPLHPVALVDIDQRAIAEAVSRVRRERGETAGNRASSALAGYLRHLAALGKIGPEIAMGALLLPKAAEARRERVLSPDELHAIWNTAKPDSNYHRILRMLILAAARRSEIGDLQRSEVTADLITIGAERMKAKRPHAIPILPAMRNLITVDDGVYVFGATGNTGFSAWSVSAARFNKRLAKTMGVKLEEVVPWTPHDFRRTFSTTMNSRPDAQPHVIEACLAHALPGVAGTYNLSSQIEAKRNVLAAWHKILCGWGLDLTANL